MTRFDDIVIGAGQAGPPLAARLAAAGRKVALVERKLVGGTCVNAGCTPTKTLIASARVASVVANAADYGVDAGQPSTDLARVMARKDAVVAKSRHNLETWLAGIAGLTLIRGQAVFVDPHHVEIDGTRYEAERFFINVGGRPAVPDLPGIGAVSVLTSSSILELEDLPDHLVVVGGSYVGLEFAQMFRRFGSRVTVVEKGDRLVGREDEDVSACIRTILEAEGITVRTGAECIHFHTSSAGVTVGLDCVEGGPEVEGTHVLLAMGRQPNTDDLGLEKAGVERDAHGNIVVDERLASSAAHIFALGDCNGRGAFTHTAYNDFEIVAENLLDGAHRKLSDRIGTYALYVDPPLGRVGMTDAQVRKSGRKAMTGMRPMTRVGRAIEKGETQGFMKITADAETGEILGGAIIGVGADEAIHSIIDMMAAGAPVDLLRRTVHVHPTVSELIPTIAGELKPLA